jgi:hypothetical protein
MLEMRMTRSELRAYDAKQLASLLTVARNMFRCPARRQQLGQSLRRSEEAVRDTLRRLIWCVLAIQAEQVRQHSRDAETRRMIDGLAPAETAGQKRRREQLRATLLNAASHSKRQRKTVRVPR